MDAPVNDDVFADDNIVADFTEGGVPLIAEILRLGRDNGTLEDAAVVAHARSRHKGSVGENLAVVADLDILVDESEGIDGNVLA